MKLFVIIKCSPFTNSGIGKTYASAFAMREFGFKRELFLIHCVTLK